MRGVGGGDQDRVDDRAREDFGGVGGDEVDAPPGPAAFKEIDVGGNSALRSEMTKRASGRTTVPQIFIGATHIGGCDDLYALDEAGQLDPLLAGPAA